MSVLSISGVQYQRGASQPIDTAFTATRGQLQDGHYGQGDGKVATIPYEKMVWVNDEGKLTTLYNVQPAGEGYTFSEHVYEPSSNITTLKQADYEAIISLPLTITTYKADGDITLIREGQPTNDLFSCQYDKIPSGTEFQVASDGTITFNVAPTQNVYFASVSTESGLQVASINNIDISLDNFLLIVNSPVQKIRVNSSEITLEDSDIATSTGLYKIAKAGSTYTAKLLNKEHETTPTGDEQDIDNIPTYPVTVGASVGKWTGINKCTCAWDQSDKAYLVHNGVSYYVDQNLVSVEVVDGYITKKSNALYFIRKTLTYSDASKVYTSGNIETIINEARQYATEDVIIRINFKDSVSKTVQVTHNGDYVILAS